MMKSIAEITSRSFMMALFFSSGVSAFRPPSH